MAKQTAAFLGGPEPAAAPPREAEESAVAEPTASTHCLAAEEDPNSPFRDHAKRLRRRPQGTAGKEKECYWAGDRGRLMCAEVTRRCIFSSTPTHIYESIRATRPFLREATGRNSRRPPTILRWPFEKSKDSLISLQSTAHRHQRWDSIETKFKPTSEH